MGAIQFALESIFDKLVILINKNTGNKKLIRSGILGKLLEIFCDF